MTEQQIKEIIQKTIIEYIANKVVTKLMQPQLIKNIFVVFTGSTINFPIALENLSKLKKEGMIFSVYMTESARELLDVAKIEEVLEPEYIYTGDMKVVFKKSLSKSEANKAGDFSLESSLNDDNIKAKFPEQQIANYEMIVVPSMTANTVAKIAYGISDTTGVRIITNALMKGKKVIVAVDGCCPDNEERVKKGYKINENLKQQLRNNISKIESYGVTLTTASKLYDKVKRISVKRLFSEKEILENKSVKNSYVNDKNIIESSSKDNNILFLDKKIISSSDIISNKNYSVIKIKKETQVTQLAREMAQKYCLKITY